MSWVAIINVQSEKECAEYTTLGGSGGEFSEKKKTHYVN